MPAKTSDKLDYTVGNLSIIRITTKPNSPVWSALYGRRDGCWHVQWGANKPGMPLISRKTALRLARKYLHENEGVWLLRGIVSKTPEDAGW